MSYYETKKKKTVNQSCEKSIARPVRKIKTKNKKTSKAKKIESRHFSSFFS